MGLSCGPFTQLSGSSLKDNEWSPPQWKLACTPSWMSPPSASSESSSSKREELLNPSPPDTNPWKIKKVLLFVFAPPFLLTKIELDSNELSPTLFKDAFWWGRQKFLFSHFRKNSIFHAERRSGRHSYILFSFPRFSF